MQDARSRSLSLRQLWQHQGTELLLLASYLAAGGGLGRRSGTLVATCELRHVGSADFFFWKVHLTSRNWTYHNSAWRDSPTKPAHALVVITSGVIVMLVVIN